MALIPNDFKSYITLSKTDEEIDMKIVLVNIRNDAFCFGLAGFSIWNFILSMLCSYI